MQPSTAPDNAGLCPQQAMVILKLRYQYMLRLPLLLIGLGLWATVGGKALALPPMDDIPEEILRTEVITQARSPIDGEPISTADYAALQDRLRDPNVEVAVSSDLTQLVRLLQLRRALRPILPFLR